MSGTRFDDRAFPIDGTFPSMHRQEEPDMQPLEKLLEQFPDTPRNIVIKADILRRGVRRNQDIQDAGAQSNTTGLSSKLERAVGATEPPPSQFHFLADETTVDIKIDDESPYEIREDADGSYRLFYGEEPLGGVRFTGRPSYMDKKTSNGTPCEDFLLHRGPSCICVSPLNFCAYLKKGEACRYCLCSPAMDVGIQMKLMDPVPDYKALAEAMDIACREDVDLKELKLTGGALYDTRKEAGYYKQCLEAILARISPPEEVTLLAQAFEPDDQKELKDLGVTNVCFDLEVMDERLWHELVPGKARAVGRDEWMKRLDAAVEIFGRGHVGSNFVGGVRVRAPARVPLAGRGVQGLHGGFRTAHRAGGRSVVHHLDRTPPGGGFPDGRPAPHRVLPAPGTGGPRTAGAVRGLPGPWVFRDGIGSGHPGSLLLLLLQHAVHARLPPVAGATGVTAASTPWLRRRV